MDDHILQSLDQNVLTITLNRPERLNSFNADMLVDLRQIIETAATDETCRALLLTGAGRGFSAGQDLGDRDPRKMTGPIDLSHTITTYYLPLIQQIRATAKPIICAVNGVAAGAGANVALACDIVIAGESAKFIQSFAKVGLVPDAGGTWMLPRLIGEARAKMIALTAQPVSANQAEDWGMIARSVADDVLISEAHALAADLAKGPTFGLGMTKMALQGATDNSLAEQLVLEAEYQGRCGRSPDYKEGVTAFLEKRPPLFVGKESN